MKLTVSVVNHQGLLPWRQQLMELERQICYPLSEGEDHFYIDMGRDPGRFFSDIGESIFLLAHKGEQLAGFTCFVKKQIGIGASVHNALYMAGLKVAPSFRGQGVVQRMLFKGLRTWVWRPGLYNVSAIFGAAMVSDNGTDVRQSFSRQALGYSSRTTAELLVYSVAGDILANISDSAPPWPQEGFTQLSTDLPCIVDNQEVKSFRLVSTGQRWKQVHLPFSAPYWPDGLGHYLRKSGQIICQKWPGHAGVFAIDTTLAEQHAFLRSFGITPWGRCRILTWDIPWRRSPWSGAPIHLSTSEI